MKLIKLAATTSAYISAIKRTNFEAVKRHSNEFRSQTPVHRTDWTQIQTHTHRDLPPTDSHRHKSFSSIEYEKSLPFCCHICCFRFPPTAAQTSSSHFGWDFSFRPSPQFLFTFFCDLLKGSQQLINFVLCMGISLFPFPHIFFSIPLLFSMCEQSNFCKAFMSSNFRC